MFKVKIDRRERKIDKYIKWGILINIFWLLMYLGEKYY